MYGKFLSSGVAPTGDGASTTAKGNPVRRDFVGWTGLSPIAMLFEFVFGIQPDVPKGEISWRINLTERHGVEKYPFGRDGELTLLCEERKSPDEKPQITLQSNVPVKLTVCWGDGQSMVFE